MSKHTEGRWFVGGGKYGVTGPTVPSSEGATCGERVGDAKPSQVVSVLDGNDCGLPIGSVVGIFPHRNGEGEANARLFAAAPDLYEAACRVLRQTDVIGIEAGVMLAEAIAKAEGKTL